MGWINAIDTMLPLLSLNTDAVGEKRPHEEEPGAGGGSESVEHFKWEKYKGLDRKTQKSISDLVLDIDEPPYTAWKHDKQTYTKNVPGLKDSDLRILLSALNGIGVKPMTEWFLDNFERLRSLATDIDRNQWYRNAVVQWWVGPRSKEAAPEDAPGDAPEAAPVEWMNLSRETNGEVIVDLWHTRWGNDVDFREFNSKTATFFFGSLGDVYANMDDLLEYVGDPDEECGGPERLYVKRGRFKLKPLLWFDDTDVTKLRADTQKAGVVAKMVGSSYYYKHRTALELDKKCDNVWKRVLYQSDTPDIGGVVHPELRLDNNCVESADALKSGYNATLSVDVSGIQGAMLSPGSVSPASYSLVVWDVPGTLLEEWDWEELDL